MSFELKDRVPTRPNRKLITPEGGGAPYFATVVHADEPVEVGTPINKATLENLIAPSKAYTLTHSKLGTVHTLSGLPNTDGIYQCQFIATADYDEGDTFADGYTAKPNGEETKLLDKAFVIGDIVSIAADTGEKKLGFKIGGSGINDTLPSLPIFSLSPKSSSAIINFTELSDIDYPYLMDYVFVYKTGSYPTGYKDGTPIIISKEQSGKERSFEISGLMSGETYYFRVFTRNFKKQIQTMIIDAFRKIKLGYEEPYTLEPLSVPRYYATSSSFTSGVGVFGGYTGSESADTVDFYDSNKMHSTLTPISQARNSLTSSPLADGVIVSGGGIGGQVLDISEFYDSNKIRSTITPLKVNRYRLTSSPLAGGVGVFGGTGQTYPVDTVNVDFYDSNKTHTTLTNLSKARGLATSSPLADGVGIFGGGEGANNMTSLDTSDFYNKDKVRTTLTPLSQARRALTSSSFLNGVIVSGGLSSEASNASDFYNSENVRTVLSPLSVSRHSLTSSPLADGVAVFGGVGVSDSNVVDFYNKNKVRTTLTPLSIARGILVSSPLAEGTAVFGGIGSKTVSTVDFYPEASTIPQT